MKPPAVAGSAASADLVMLSARFAAILSSSARFTVTAALPICRGESEAGAASTCCGQHNGFGVLYHFFVDNSHRNAYRRSDRQVSLP